MLAASSSCSAAAIGGLSLLSFTALSGTPAAAVFGRGGLGLGRNDCVPNFSDGTLAAVIGLAVTSRDPG